ncbi:hypothetical protein TVAG_316880 [Trichomonas vaginalis G3]|uniref:VPS9 domain-containing protein n=1 Tax=Trichomonas vaginalis (strain ATCC PRA-98 / G3) TaxID=412133 RepID=A2F065_TRIV3|nr:hypothetical protein TVAGG3_0985580 [Trichomonas vaginalis G3]EAY01700.1 hypothetical protein TVAG_316880 [Trichomonas vaginalis G3]KAI5489635.1 hypothetical protein TVAGG3_0985580 [Trichomonas vaginalis G3]|eukprot:XP_001330396.1 hypothetical protein [Trichomonas vaginalis G3]
MSDEEDFQYESILSLYTSPLDQPNSEDQNSRSLISLAEYLDFIDNSIEQEKEKAMDFKIIDPSSYDDKIYMYLYVLNYFSKETDNEILKKAMEFSEETKKVTRLLMNKLKKDNSIYVNDKKFISDMKSRILKNKELLQLRFYKNSLNAKMNDMISAFPLPLLINELKSTYSSAFYKYDDTLNYIHYPPFDRALSMYLHHSHFSTMIDPICRVIADGNIKSALIALSELTELLMAEIQNIQSIGKYVMYISLVRVIFEESYAIYPELNLFRKANLLFLSRCYAFSDRTIGDISDMLPKYIVRNYTKGLLVKTMFKKKSVGLLQELEYMINPIDLMIHIYKSCMHIKQYFASDAGILSEKDMNVLLLCLLSIAPPCNCVSIARFLFHWKDIALKPEAKACIDNFVGAVQILYNFTENVEEEEEEE